MYPGSYAPVKLNLYNVILVVDFSSAHTLSFLAGPVASIVERNYPFRFGVVPDLGREGERGESEYTSLPLPDSRVRPFTNIPPFLFLFLSLLIKR